MTARTTIVCLPDQAGWDRFGELPTGVRTITWDGRNVPPPGAADAEFVVAPYQGAYDVDHLVQGLPGAQVFQLLTAGFDAWRGRLPSGAALCNGRGVHTGSTAELALTLVLASVREIPAFTRQQDESQWQARRTGELQGRRALIVGDGDIGQALDRRLRACDVRTSRVARSAREGVHAVAELPALLPEHDIVVITVPLTEATEGLVDAAFLSAMPDGALLVNVARGGVVDTDALVAEVKSGRLDAALDVVDPEPLPPDSPLWSLPNVLITPHVGGGTVGWLARGFQLIRDQLHRYLDGEPLHNVVDPG